MLVNGKNAANFIKRDLNNLHEIIKGTTINGASINIQNTNDLLAKQLKDVIHSMNISTNGMQATVNEEMNDIIEKCFKCKRSCRSRAVLCVNKHWVHFNCEKFTKLEIEQIEQNENEPYTCSQCKTKEVRKNRCTPNKIEEQQQTDSQITKYQHKQSEDIMSPTLAQRLLQEELMNTCLVCSNILTSDTTPCMVCSLSYHLGCVDINNGTCYACLGNQHQIDQHNNIAEETALPIVRRETTTTFNEIPQTQTEHETNVSQQISVTNQKQKPHIPNNENSIPTGTSNSAQTENLELKLKDLRQLEIRLKKKEEHLKIKETMLNEDAKEKSKILDRLFKAESRNCELEQTVKTLNRKI